MIAPSYWVDPKSGNDYLLTVQYPEGQREKSGRSLARFPLRALATVRLPARLDAVSHIRAHPAPTEVDHYQLRRVIDVYVAPTGEDLGQVVDRCAHDSGRDANCPRACASRCAASVQGMQASFRSFGFGLILSVVAGLSDSGGAV